MRAAGSLRWCVSLCVDDATSCASSLRVETDRYRSCDGGSMLSNIDHEWQGTCPPARYNSAHCGRRCGFAALHTGHIHQPVLQRLRTLLQFNRTWMHQTISTGQGKRKAERL